MPGGPRTALTRRRAPSAVHVSLAPRRLEERSTAWCKKGAREGARRASATACNTVPFPGIHSLHARCTAGQAARRWAAPSSPREHRGQAPNWLGARASPTCGRSGGLTSWAGRDRAVASVPLSTSGGQHPRHQSRPGPRGPGVRIPKKIWPWPQPTHARGKATRMPRGRRSLPQRSPPPKRRRSWESAPKSRAALQVVHGESPGSHGRLADCRASQAMDASPYSVAHRRA